MDHWCGVQLEETRKCDLWLSGSLTENQQGRQWLLLVLQRTVLSLVQTTPRLWYWVPLLQRGYTLCLLYKTRTWMKIVESYEAVHIFLLQTAEGKSIKFGTGGSTRNVVGEFIFGLHGFNTTPTSYCRDRVSSCNIYAVQQDTQSVSMSEFIQHLR